MTVYQRIRDLRENRDLKQRELAEYLQIHQTTYSSYELGRVNIPPDVLIKLAKLYGASIDYHLGCTDNPKPYE